MLDRKARSELGIEDGQEASRGSSSSPTLRIKYLVIAGLVLAYFVLPLPAVLSVGTYLSASSSSALSSLLSSLSSSHIPCHSIYSEHERSADDLHCHARGYKAIFGSQRNAVYAKGRPSLHASARSDAYNQKIEEAFLKVPNNENCIAASRRCDSVPLISKHLRNKLTRDYPTFYLIQLYWLPARCRNTWWV